MAGARILLVEDDAAQAEMYGLGLHLAGHSVRYVHDGWAAVRATLGESPDLVLMDFHLPVMDGLRALRALRSHPGGRSVRVVMFTNHEDVADLEQAQQLNVLDWVLKSGVTPKQLSQRIAEWLD